MWQLEQAGGIAVICDASLDPTTSCVCVTCSNAAGSELAVVHREPATTVTNLKTDVAQCMGVKSYLLQIVGPRGVMEDMELIEELIRPH